MTDADKLCHSLNISENVNKSNYKIVIRINIMKDHNEDNFLHAKTKFSIVCYTEIVYKIILSFRLSKNIIWIRVNYCKLVDEIHSFNVSKSWILIWFLYRFRNGTYEYFRCRFFLSRHHTIVVVAFTSNWRHLYFCTLKAHLKWISYLNCS